MSTDQTTTIPQSTVRPTLRSVGIPTEPPSITPAEWPTDADVDRALGAYGDRIGQPAAWGAFGDDLPKGAA